MSSRRSFRLQSTLHLLLFRQSSSRSLLRHLPLVLHRLRRSPWTLCPVLAALLRSSCRPLVLLLALLPLSHRRRRLLPLFFPPPRARLLPGLGRGPLLLPLRALRPLRPFLCPLRAALAPFARVALLPLLLRCLLLPLDIASSSAPEVTSSYVTTWVRVGVNRARALYDTVVSSVFHPFPFVSIEFWTMYSASFS